MKVVKDNDLSLLFKPWGYEDKFYLHLTTVVGFNLLAPETLLSEQELWGKLPALLGEGGQLDESMPKVRGEFLVSGCCHAPAGEKIRAARVRVTVGALSKELHVYGNRYWQRNPVGLLTISQPEPFAALDLSYHNAFGGGDYPKNPLGKGISERTEGGQPRWPLPNIELPGREIGAPTDRPEPAGFGPLDRMWPQRFQRVGTYDQKWQKTRWPYFPADMDYEFFNLAPADQRLEGYFKGDERFLLEGLHPQYQRLENSLPPIRPRQFVYQKIDPARDFNKDNLRFQEARLKLDTVWFFPEALLGILILHGSVEIQDEDYLDVHRLFLTKEAAASQPRDLDHYREKLLASMDLSVPVDMAPFAEAAPKFERLLKQWRNIPKQIEDVKQRALGKAPKMSYTPDETAAKLKKVLAEGHATLDKLETQALEMHGQYGHLAKIDLTGFDGWRRRLGQMEQRTDEMAATAARMQEQAREAEKETGQMLKANLTARQLQEKNIDPDNPLRPAPADPWQQTAFAMVLQARKNLANDPATLQQLIALGFEPPTIKRAWLGMVPASMQLDPRELQLDPATLAADPITIPAGLLLPVFAEEKVSRIAVRKEADWTTAAGEFFLPGSTRTPVLMPACLQENPPVVVVCEQLAAILLEQEVGDFCTIVWLPDPNAELGEEVEAALADALHLLVITTTAEPEAELNRWAAGYENAGPLIIPDDQPSLPAARQRGLKIRPWLLKFLPEALAREHDIEISLPAAGEAPGNSPAKGNLLPPMDIKGMIEKALAAVNTSYQPMKEAMALELEQNIAQAAKSLNLPRSELDAAIAKAQASSPAGPQEIGRQVTERLNVGREELRQQQLLTAEIDAKYREAIARIQKAADENQANADRLNARLAEAKSELAEKKAQLAAGKLPADNVAKMKAAGLDPERTRALTREEVIELHGRGESLSLYNLSGLDLSDLDLSGADLSRARCVETRFINTILKGANLSQLIANQADFSGADLSEALARMAIFTKARLQATVCRKVRFKQVSFKDSELNQADFAEAELELSSFDSCRADDASFENARLNLVVFSAVTGKSINFRRINGYKCLLQNCLLDRADFSRATLAASMLLGCRGEDVRFGEADLSRTTICRRSAFPAADLRRARLVESCLKESELIGADLRQARMDGALVEDCNLSGACLRKTLSPGTRFIRVNLEGADLRGINLITGSLRRSRLVKADLSASNLYGVDFYKAVLGQTKLAEANLKLTLLAGQRPQYLENSATDLG